MATMEPIKLIKLTNQCIFCLEPVGPPVEGAIVGDNGENEKVVTGSIFSLQQICHYFKENLHRELVIIPNTSLSQDGLNLKMEPILKEDCSKEKKSSVLLCHNCLTVCQRLTELCKELEIIQMQLDYSVKQLINCVAVASPLSSGQRNHASLLKSRRLCVPLSRCDPLLKAIVKVEVAKDFLGDSTDSATPCRQNREESRTNKSNPGTCDFCPKSFPSESKKILHTTVAHPYHFLSAAKLDAVTQEHFQAFCWRLIQQQCHKETLDKNGSRKCPYCNVRYKNRKDMKIHLVNIHSNKLITKLTEIQLQRMETTKNIIKKRHNQGVKPAIPQVHDEVHPTVKSLLQQIKEQTSKHQEGQSFRTCALCSDPSPSFLDPITLEKHIFEVHPDYFFLSVKKTVVAVQIFQALCFDAVQHFQSCNPLPDTGGHNLQTCSICSCTFLDKGFLARHQIQAHFNLLCQKVLELQDKSEGSTPPQLLGRSALYESSECSKCGRTFDSRFALAAHLSQRHRGTSPPPGTVINPVSQNQCGQCCRTFSCSTSLKRHQEFSCVPTVTPSRQQQEQRQTTFKCNLCDHSFFHKYYLQRHLSTVHGKNTRKQKPRRKERIACEHCGILVRTSNLNRHLKNSCQKSKKKPSPQKSNKAKENGAAQCVNGMLNSDGDEDSIDGECNNSENEEEVGRVVKIDVTPITPADCNDLDSSQYVYHQSWELEKNQFFFEEEEQLTVKEDPLI